MGLRAAANEVALLGGAHFEGAGAERHRAAEQTPAGIGEPVQIVGREIEREGAATSV